MRRQAQHTSMVCEHWRRDANAAGGLFQGQLVRSYARPAYKPRQVRKEATVVEFDLCRGESRRCKTAGVPDYSFNQARPALT